MRSYFFLKFFITTVLLFGLANALYSQSSSEIYPIPGSDVLRKHGQLIQNNRLLHSAIKTQTTALRKTTGSWGFNPGSTHNWYATNLVTNTEYLVPSTCRAVGNYCYIFVEDSNWTTATGTVTGKVNQAVVDSVLSAFETRIPANPARGIYQTDTSTFGKPPIQNIYNDPKIIILILNIRDGFTGTGGYVAGYFYDINEYPDAEVQQELGSTRHSNNTEILYIDCNPANLTTTTGFTDACSTTAHEFQHMIHFNYNYIVNGDLNGGNGVDHLTFINEGCSVFAEVNCGYTIYQQNLYEGETNHYLLDWRTDSINAVQKDYSRAARYFTYLHDQIGIGVFKKIVASVYDSVNCFNDALKNVGSAHRFNDLLPDWFIANILNDTTVNPLYGYRYAGLADVSTINYNTPNNSVSNISVERYASQYYSITGGYHLKAKFTTDSSSLFVQAVETGSGASRVVAVPTNAQFSEPLYGTTYSKINFIVYDTSGSHTSTFSFTTSGDSTAATDVTASSSLPHQYGLNQNYPNPFNPTTVIRYQLPAAGIVSLKVYDLLGHEIATLVNQNMPSGVHSVSFDGSHFASGVYFYRIIADHFTETKKFVLLK